MVVVCLEFQRVEAGYCCVDLCWDGLVVFVGVWTRRCAEGVWSGGVEVSAGTGRTIYFCRGGGGGAWHGGGLARL